jgi:hypothetical protein
VVYLQIVTVVHADGGMVRLSERRGGHRITVFTSPTPLRVGPVDVSIFVQDAATGEPVSAVSIAVQASPHKHPETVIRQMATTADATNKLFQAAVFDLPEPGRWDLTIVVEGTSEPIEVPFAVEVDEPLPRIGEMIPWIAWPAGAILLFCLHQWLVQRKSPRP